MSEPTQTLFENRDFKFLGELSILEGELAGVWKIYGLDYMDNTGNFIFDPETLVPYRPLHPVSYRYTIGILGDRIRKFPSILNDQVVDCVSVDEPILGQPARRCKIRTVTPNRMPVVGGEAGLAEIPRLDSASQDPQQ